MLFAFNVLNILSIAYALGIENTAYVPPSCPGGRQWYNGACRKPVLGAATSPKSQRKLSDIFSDNLIDVSSNCPGGQQYINGQCRDIWRGDNIVQYPHALKVGNTVSGPPQCSGGQQWSNGRCRDSFLRTAKSPESQRKISDIFSAKTIHVRSACPGGQQYINGQCRDLWRSGDLAHLQRPLAKYRYPHALKIGNTVSVPPNRSGDQRRNNGGCHDPLLSATASPESQWKISDISAANSMHVHPNCPGGQQFINGQCHYVWRSVDLATNPPALGFANTATVPSKCSDGKQWYMGECRDLFLRAAASPELQNLVPASPKCLGDQQYINGQCHKVWRSDDLAKMSAFSSANLVPVPSKCSGGQQYINGQCHEVWRSDGFLKMSAVSSANLVPVPSKCPGGQQFINGQCHEVWRSEDLAKMSAVSSSNLVPVPPKCPGGQQYINGQCHEVWRSDDLAYPNTLGFVNTENVPPNCSGGQEWNNGACRDLLLRGATSQDSQSGQQWNNKGCHDPSLNATKYLESQKKISPMYFRNMISVPSNCPPGYNYINGQCREIFRTSDYTDSMVYQQLIQLLDDYVKKIQRTRIEGFNQCPPGFRVDALGICRPIL